MALRSIENNRPKRYLHSKFSIAPSKKNQQDVYDVNYENNKFIDDLFTDEPKYEEKIFSHSQHGASSITIFKRIRVEKEKQKKALDMTENKENVIVKQERKRACVARTYEKIQNISIYLGECSSKKNDKSVYDFDDELSDEELTSLVQRGNKKRAQAKSRTKKPTRAKQAEMDKILEMEERAIKEAASEYSTIKNYKLIVETVNDDY